MSTSLLHASSARAAGTYLAASRVRARRDLVERVGIDFCRSHRVLPLRPEAEAVLCAVSRPRDSATLDELRRLLGRPVLARVSSPGEIRLGIAATVGTPPRSEWRRALGDVLESMQVLSRDQATTYAVGAEEETCLGAALVDARLLSEEERVEAIGLAFHLSSIDLRHALPRRDLVGLLPAAEIARHRVLPLAAAAGELIVAVDEPPSADLMERLDVLLGMPVQPVLVPHADLSREIAALDGDTHGRATDVHEALRALRVLPEAELHAATTIARQTGEPLERVVVRTSGLPEAAVLEAVARRAGAATQTYRGIESVQTEAIALLPERLARRLGAVAIRQDDDEAAVAMVDPWDERTRQALSGLLRRRLHTVMVSRDQLTEILDRSGNGSPRRSAGPAEARRTLDVLIQCGFIRRSEAARVSVDLERAGERDLPLLWALLDDARRSEALALDARLPLIDRLLVRPDPRAADLRPADDRARTVIPILQQDEILSVAVPTADSIEDARGLAGRYRAALRLAVARGEQIATAYEHLGSLRLTQVDEDHHEFTRLLERRLDLPRVRSLALLRRVQETGEPLDLAVRQLELLPMGELRDAFAAFLGVPSISLGRSDRLQTDTVDGVTVTRRVLEDPVDHGVARTVAHEQAVSCGALPVGYDSGRLVVAVADPLDRRSLERLRDLLPASAPLFRPARRSDIVEAARRAHGRPTIGDLLLEADIVSRADLERGLALAESAGVRLGEALLSLGVVSEEQLGEQIAHQHGMPFIAIRGIELDPEVAGLIPEELAREHEVIPVSRDPDGGLTVAVADPSNRRSLEAVATQLGPDVNLVATTRSDIRDGLERLFHRRYLDHSASDLVRRTPENSAFRVLSRPQQVFFIGLVAVLAGALALWTINTLIVLVALSTFFYLGFSTYKFYLIYRALSHTLEVPITQRDIEAIDDRLLPVYTILVPLYREAEVLPSLVRGLSRLDYPIEKLDVKLLLEEDDPETIRVARESNLPPSFDITIVPDGPPKGKPKACNYGLLHARGEFVVIFDAEDIPEPDQLKKVLVAFNKSPENVVCVQAKLNYYNRNQNALTKWFTTEYSTWFDLFLPGLDASGAPIPLGGTSNHFKAEILKEVGGWDPFNVTEDADLGLRIFKLGGATVVVDSTTFEEANSVLDNWIRQRSRWVKGYIQTYLVHMRNPLLLWRQLGPAGFVSFQLVIGGTFFGFLLNPLLWGLTGVWFLTHWSVIQHIFPPPIFYMGTVSLYVGNFAFAYMNVAGCLRRRYYSLVKWALLSPVYWILMSIAAWKGFLQLFYRPFYWEKTIHGLSNVSGLEASEANG